MLHPFPVLRRASTSFTQRLHLASGISFLPSLRMPSSKGEPTDPQLREKIKEEVKGEEKGESGHDLLLNLDSSKAYAISGFVLIPP